MGVSRAYSQEMEIPVGGSRPCPSGKHRHFPDPKRRHPNCPLQLSRSRPLGSTGSFAGLNHIEVNLCGLFNIEHACKDLSAPGENSPLPD